MGPDLRWDVFLCHSSADKVVVRQLAGVLRGKGKRVWLDEEQIGPGDSVVGRIDEGLRHSRQVVVCLSDAQRASGWSRAEFEAALHAELSDGGKRVIPVVVGDLDESKLPALLRPKRRVDWRSTAGQEELLGWISGDAPRLPRGEPTELRLRLRKRDEQIEARWLQREEDPHSFEIPMVPGDADDHRWYLEQYLRMPGPGDHARARRFEKRMQGWGEKLYQALWPHGGTHPLDDLAAKDGEKLLTIVSQDPAVLALPWELLRTPRGSLVLVDVSIRRQFPNTKAGEAPSVGIPLRVLLVVSRPTDAGFIDPRTSARPMLDALERLGGNVALSFCDPPTLAELNRRLAAARKSRQPFHVVHFDGHGVYLKDTGVGALCFEKADATKDLVSGGDLGELLAAMQVPLALLEACQTADLSDTVFGSVAPALLRHGVGSVVAFSHSVTVTGATILVQALYQALCDGDAVGEALIAGRRALQANPARRIGHRQHIDLRDWHIAQLYQVGADPVLVPGGAPARAGGSPLHRGRAPDRRFPPAPIYGFTGRAHDLLRLRRALRKHPAVVVHGGGGMGKTSLAGEAARWWVRTGLRPGGACFVSFEDRTGPIQACRRLIAYVEGQDAVPASDDDAWDRALALFRERPLLWVWDNFESTLPQYNRDGSGELDEATAYPEEDRCDLRRLYRALVDPEHRPQGWLLVTCRPDDTHLPGIQRLHLGGLAETEALDLAEVVLERHEVPVGQPGYERAEIEALIEVLDGHPLSLELVLPHLGQGLTPKKARQELGVLLDRFANPDAEEDRNKGLRASLEFSTRRLSDAARAVLPWLAWLSGGAFEVHIIMLTGLEPAAWAAIRAELEGVALVREEETGVGGAGPFLRFHPTLPFAAAPEQVLDPAAAAGRFVAVYQAVAGGIGQALHGAEPAVGMTVARQEEANLRRAVAVAFDRGEGRAAWVIADTVGQYLNNSGRPKDQARWASWVQGRLDALAPQDGADSDEALAAERQHAWGLVLAGKAQQAVALLTAQRDRLEGAGRSRQLALCNGTLGRVLLNAGRPDLALKPLQAAVEGFSALDDQDNLSAALGHQANALQALGRLDDALPVAERGLAIVRKRGRTRAVATGLGQTAAILTAMQRYTEADRRYDDALAAARQAGDAGLEAVLLQHQGTLARQTDDLDRAAALVHDALDRFRQADDEGGEMPTADLLGTTEVLRGNLAAAEKWYDRAWELATRRGAKRQLAITAQNRGILYQAMAGALDDDPARSQERTALLHRAVASIEESLAIKRDQHNQPGIAASLSQLGVLHLEIGELDTAERHLLDSRAIRERLGAPDVYKDYAALELVAKARGDTAAAAEWAAKKDAKLAELQRLHAGPDGGPTRLPRQVLQGLQQLAQAAYACNQAGGTVPADLAEVLSQLSQAPPPFPAVGAVLSAVAHARPIPPLPDDLPPELAELLSGLVGAVGG